MSIQEEHIMKLAHEKSGWRGFKDGTWKQQVDVRDFIEQNITLYEGNADFLQGPTENTKALWEVIQKLTKDEIAHGGVLDVDVNTVSTITSHGPGYIDQAKEKIVGLQTDEPFKRSIQPFGGIKMMVDACKAYGFELPQDMIRLFTDIRKTHNQGVFDAYTSEMRTARRAGIITGLPDAYGRGRIIGDYRRVALYGINFLSEQKKQELAGLEVDVMNERVIQLREELSEQIRALDELRQMAASYGYDISQPANNAQEAIQWVYFAYLAAVKEQNGAAMSLGRVSSFLDIFMERDIQEGTLTELEAQ